MIRSFLSGCMALLLLATSSSAEEVLQIDRRTSTDVDGQYFLVFCARHSPTLKFPGHAFVIWVEESEAQQMSISHAFGFYPADEKKMVLGDVPSEVKDEALMKGSTNSKLLTHRLIVQVNKNDYQATRKVIEKWKTKDYNLFSQNCVNFTHDVATSVGLKVPQTGRIAVPADYFQSLFKLQSK